MLEGHDGGGDGDAALLLDLHPIRLRAARFSARGHAARLVDRACGQQHVLSQRCLTRIRMRDNRKNAAAHGFNFKGFGHGGWIGAGGRGGNREGETVDETSGFVRSPR